MRNKKAVVASDDIVAALITILVIVVFILGMSYYLITNGISFSKQVNEREKNIDAERRLTEFLTLMVEHDINNDGTPETIQMKELLAYSYLNNEYTAMQNAAREYLKSIQRHELSGWNIRINLMPENEEIPEASVLLFDAQIRSLKESSVVVFEEELESKPPKDINTLLLTADAVAIVPILGKQQWLQIRLFEKEGI